MSKSMLVFCDVCLFVKLNHAVFDNWRIIHNFANP